MLLLYDTLFKHSIQLESQELYDTIDYLDSNLFQIYIGRKSVKVTEIIRNGILYAGIDWASMPKPTGKKEQKRKRKEKKERKV